MVVGAVRKDRCDDRNRVQRHAALPFSASWRLIFVLVAAPQGAWMQRRVASKRSLVSGAQAGRTVLKKDSFADQNTEPKHSRSWLRSARCSSRIPNWWKLELRTNVLEPREM